MAEQPLPEGVAPPAWPQSWGLHNGGAVGLARARGLGPAVEAFLCTEQGFADPAAEGREASLLPAGEVFPHPPAGAAALFFDTSGRKAVPAGNSPLRCDDPSWTEQVRGAATAYSCNPDGESLLQL